MALQRHQIDVTTASDGTATAYSAYPVHGVVQAITYDKGTFSAGIDFTITGEKSTIPILAITDANTSTTYLPRAATHGTTGTAALYAAGGLGVLDRIPVAMERIKVVIAQGGNATTGTFHVYVDA